MKRKIIVFSTIVSLTLLGIGVTKSKADEKDLQADLQASRAAFTEAKTPEEKLVVVNDLLTKHPEHRYIGEVLGALVYVRGNLMSDKAGAIEAVEKHITLMKDPGFINQAKRVLLSLLDEPQFADRFSAIARELMSAEGASFGLYLDLLEKGANIGNWDLVLDVCEAAQPLANTEAYRADYPNQGYSEEEYAAAGNNRQALLKSSYGWAIANKGEVDKALAIFAEADTMARRTFFDLPDSELYRFWGQTLLMNKDYDGAIAKLAPAALWGTDNVAMEALKEAYADKTGGKEGFEAFLNEYRMSDARTMGDFSAADYSGTVHDFAKIKGRVTLLAFWFPT